MRIISFMRSENRKPKRTKYFIMNNALEDVKKRKPNKQ